MERFEDPTQSNVDLQRPEPSKLNPDAPIFHYSIPFTQSISNTSSPFSIAPSFHPYPYATPDPQIHGEGPFVAALPARDRALVSSQPQLDQRPMWHSDATRVGGVYDENSVFVKHRKDGCISLLYEQQLRERGIHGYSFTILHGDISASDGIGFVFGDRVPCSKNIKRLWSVFVNRTGCIVKRMGPNLVRSDKPLLPLLSVGQVLSMVIDLDQYRVAFQVKAPHSDFVLSRTFIDLSDIAERVDASRGYLCAAVTSAGMVVHLDRSPSNLFDLPSIDLKAYCSQRRTLLHHHRPPSHHTNSFIPRYGNSHNNDEVWDFQSSLSPPLDPTFSSTLLPHQPYRQDHQVSDSDLRFLNMVSKKPSSFMSNRSYPNKPDPFISSGWSPMPTNSVLDLKTDCSINTPMFNTLSPEEYAKVISHQKQPFLFRSNDSSENASNYSRKSMVENVAREGIFPHSSLSQLNNDPSLSQLSHDQLNHDPMLLSIDTRGLSTNSTNSDSSTFVGVSHRSTFESEAFDLLKALGQFRNHFEINNSRIGESDVEEFDEISALREDDNNINPLSLSGNRTVSAPPV